MDQPSTPSMSTVESTLHGHRVMLRGPADDVEDIAGYLREEASDQSSAGLADAPASGTDVLLEVHSGGAVTVRTAPAVEPPGKDLIWPAQGGGWRADPSEWEADLAVATLLSRVREIEEADALVRAGGWRPSAPPSTVHASTVGLCARAGRTCDAVSVRLRALGAEVVMLSQTTVPPSGPLDAVLVLEAGAEDWERLAPQVQGEPLVVVAVPREPGPLTRHGQMRRIVGTIARLP